jgi:predicted transposase YdaD
MIAAHVFCRISRSGGAVADNQPFSRPDSSALIDRSVKALIRQVPGAFFRLAGVETGLSPIRYEDVTVSIPEHRADQVLSLGADDDPDRWASHLEYQLQPDARVLRGWFFKNAGLNAQLDMPVILTVLYLTRGNSAPFPDTVTIQGGGLSNHYQFNTIRLWEHTDRIRGGDLPELAPLLLLCEDNPTEQTLREERALILDLSTTREVRVELLAEALTVGTRYFARELLETLFREELQMLKEASIVGDWLEEALQEGYEKGIQEGIQQGIQQGKTEATQEFVLDFLRERFGELSPAVVTRVQSADLAWCKEFIQRASRANSLEELEH